VNPNEELQHRLVAILREVAETFPTQQVRDLCYGCGIDAQQVLTIDTARVAPTPVAWMQEIGGRTPTP
jgi:hypothetical protein